jgi:hypothetical protein
LAIKVVKIEEVVATVASWPTTKKRPSKLETGSANATGSPKIITKKNKAIANSAMVIGSIFNQLSIFSVFPASMISIFWTS